MTEEKFRVLIPVGPLGESLPRMDVPDVVRRDLALAFALDTVAVAVRCSAVEDVVVVTRDPEVAAAFGDLQVQVLEAVDTSGVSSVISAAYAEVRKRVVPTAVLMSDLPALMPDELYAALTRVTTWHRSVFASELLGDGTTFYAGRPNGFRPTFGRRSASWNDSAGALRIGNDLPGLRCDVDDLEGLAVAKYLGVGAHTSLVLDRHPKLRSLKLTG
ncbi:NTP transferase domain-containing protein [Nocardioides humilatus]|uniref:NTP transferase domain-containing protein n=1 Tax=Nocardioides humilatus TaxID=2607660 RepID=A0A5B1LMY8_9ACTN|nr:NTP transferase domain-containing protein [Nocardioides humilatus]KAA1421913.1 NTP transferase domain-containing protein [Nocardioides humilatus]